MKKGISIHLGLNFIDPAHYGTDGRLKNCVNDAREMQSIANALGYKSRILLNEQATSENLLSELENAARQLSKDDILFLTYSGHGAQVNDINKDEKDGKDETWCLYNRMFIDDEFENAWAGFQKGVRIIMISDSCHSGTVSRYLDGTRTLLYPETMLYRCIDPEIAANVFNEHKNTYKKIKRSISRDVKSDIGASVLLISGCQDNQLSSDGTGNNGLFTTNLLRTWANGKYNGSYKNFHSQIRQLMPSIQTPNYYFTGFNDGVFETQKPFSIDNANVARSTPETGDNKVIWAIDFNNDLFRDLDEEQIRQYICDNISHVMADSYIQYRDVNSRMIMPVLRGVDFSFSVSSSRGGEISCGCSGGIRW